MKAELCPVCKGEGVRVNHGYGETAGASKYIQCHGCGGKGWVEVGDNTLPPCTVPYIKYWYPPYCSITACSVGEIT